jgi:hypothetical protein
MSRQGAAQELFQEVSAMEKEPLNRSDVQKEIQNTELLEMQIRPLTVDEAELVAGGDLPIIIND